MVSLCPFCQHSNPAAAKFCNDCGSPLRLTPCNQCGAINDRAASHCYQCTAELAARPIPAEPSLASSSLEASAFTSSWYGVDFEPGSVPLREPAQNTPDVYARRLATRRDVVAQENPPADARISSSPSELQSAIETVDLHKLATVPGAYRKSRVVLIAGLIVVVAVSAYYVSRNQARRNLGPASAVSSGLNEVGVANSGPAATQASAESSNKTTEATGDGASTSPAQSQSVNDDTPTQPPTQSTDPAQQSRQSTAAAQPLDEAGQGASRVDAVRPTGTRSTTPSASTAPSPQQPPTEFKAGAPVDAPRANVCTEAVAALGFCNPDAQAKSD